MCILLYVPRRHTYTSDLSRVKLHINNQRREKYLIIVLSFFSVSTYWQTNPHDQNGSRMFFLTLFSFMYVQLKDCGLYISVPFVTTHCIINICAVFPQWVQIISQLIVNRTEIILTQIHEQKCISAQAAEPYRIYTAVCTALPKIWSERLILNIIHLVQKLLWLTRHQTEECYKARETEPLCLLCSLFSPNCCTCPRHTPLTVWLQLSACTHSFIHTNIWIYWVFAFSTGTFSGGNNHGTHSRPALWLNWMRRLGKHQCGCTHVLCRMAMSRNDDNSTAEGQIRSGLTNSTAGLNSYH